MSPFVAFESAPIMTPSLKVTPQIVVPVFLVIGGLNPDLRRFSFLKEIPLNSVLFPQLPAYLLQFLKLNPASSSFPNKTLFIFVLFTHKTQAQMRENERKRSEKFQNLFAQLFLPFQIPLSLFKTTCNKIV